MSLRPKTCPEIPLSTAAVARAAFPRGNPYLRLRDALGTVFSDAQFAPLFPRAVGTQEALCLDEQVCVAFSFPHRSLPTAMGKEARSEVGDLGDGSPAAIGHPGVRLLG
jgi:hypothetical protein